MTDFLRRRQKALFPQAGGKNGETLRPISTPQLLSVLAHEIADKRLRQAGSFTGICASIGLSQYPAKKTAIATSSAARVQTMIFLFPADELSTVLVGAAGAPSISTRAAQLEQVRGSDTHYTQTRRRILLMKKAV